MLNTIIKKYEQSDKSKEAQYEYIKGLHGFVMDMNNIELLLQRSIINKLCIDSEKSYIELNEDYHNIKLIFNDTDWGSYSVGILGLGTYEEIETRTVLNVVKYIAEQNKFTFLDIGANEGWYTLNVKKAFRNAETYAFEPSPITYGRLINNLLVNDERIDGVFNIGLYDRNDKLIFYYDEENSGASSFMNIRDKVYIEPMEVDAVRLDDWMKENELSGVDFIKCDVEGAELFVYRGGRNVIEKYKPIIFSEMLRKWSAKFGYTPNDIIKFFGELGYGCYVIESDTKLKECPEVTEETIQTNYFFLHKSKHEKIIKEMVRH